MLPRFRHRGASLTLSIVAIVLATVAIVAVLWATLVKPAGRDATAMAHETLVRSIGLDAPVKNALDPRFTDADGDLVADPPADAAKAVDPPTLVFTYIATEEPERYRDVWADFTAHLSKVMGKPVEYLMVASPEEQLLAMHDGRLHVSGFSTGAVPVAVNACGFVPVVVFGDDAGKRTYRTQIIVPAASTTRRPEDLRGRELTLTDPSSNSGYKAPLVLLKSKHGMQPGFDYLIRYSNDMRASVEGVATGQYAAAAVASDFLDRMVAEGVIKRDQFRVIFESEAFPSAALGYAHNLRPELAAKVREAMTSFAMQGTSVGRAYAAAGQTKLVAANYKDDWSLVRLIDDGIGYQHKVQTPAPPATQPVTTSE